MKSAEKKNPVKLIFSGIGKFLIVFLSIILLWICFSIFHGKSRVSMIPTGYSAYIQTDSVWKALDPVLDLRAMDILLSSSDFSSLRGPFIDFRKSSLRKNPFLKFCANRKLSAAYYNSEKEYVCVIQMGWLSSVTRLSKWLLPYLGQDNLELIETEDFYYFAYGDNKSKVYFKPYRNLIIISSSFVKLHKAFEKDYSKDYSKEDLGLIKKKTGSKIKVFVNADRMLDEITDKNSILKKAGNLFLSEKLSMISFSLTDSDIEIKGELPLLDNDDKNLLKNASVSSIVTKIPNIVQYYTVLNSGTVEELKNLLMPLITEKGKSPWEKAEPLCKSFFGLTLEDLLCSWTGKEFAILGIEGLNDPVFAIQISDEKKRQEIFEKVISSIIIKDDTSLILNGVRLPKLMLPGFIQGLLSLLNINLPNPYYMVKDDYIYFSQSPEPLSAIYSSLNENKRITQNPNWTSVSEKQKLETSISLFYDLDRSVPFFLQGKSFVSDVLNLYSVGLFNIRINKNNLGFELHANSQKTVSLREISGFPLEAGKNPDNKLYSEKNKKSSHIFWLDNRKTIKFLDVSSLNIEEFELESEGWIVSDENPKTDTVLYALSKNGTFYALSRDMDSEKTISVFTGKIPSNPPVYYQDGIVFATIDNTLCFVNTKSDITECNIPSKTTIKGECTVYDKTVLVYEKGFKGRIFIYEDKLLINQESPLEITGIAFGSPSIIKKNGNTYISFVTQAGLLYIWENNNLINDYPVDLETTFYSNIVSDGNYFYALNDSGQIFRISTEGRILSVIIPSCTTKTGNIYTESPEFNEKKNIYVSLDGNLTYGFNDNLELLSGFPLAGCGKPAFADLNGDRYQDILVLSLDKKLNAWNLK